MIVQSPGSMIKTTHFRSLGIYISGYVFLYPIVTIINDH